MGNMVEIDLIANDLVTPVLRRIRTGINTNIGDAASDAGSQLSSNLGAGSGWVGAALGAIEILKNSFGKLFSWLSDNFSQAMDFEIGSKGSAVGIQAATQIANSTGISLSRALAITKELEKQAAISAFALPGETTDYAMTAQTIADTVAQTYNISTAEGLAAFQSTMKDLSEGIGFVAATSKGSGAEAVNRAFEGYLGGSKTIGEMRTYDDVATSPLFRTLDNLMQEKGIVNSKKISQKERLDLLMQAKQLTMSPEIIALYQDTGEGMMASIKGMLFDLQLGAFGVMRTVESEGGRSAYDAFKGVLRTTLVLMGDVQKLGKSLGITIDPMKMLIRGLDWINDLLVQVTGYVKQFSPGSINLGLSQDWAVNLMKWNRFLLNSIADVFYNINWGGIGEWLGNFIGQSFIGLLRAIADPGTWIALFRVLDAVAWGILNFAGGLVKGLFMGIFEQIKAGFASDFKNLMKFFSTPIEEIGKFNKYLAGQFKRLQDFFGDIFNGVSSAIAYLINMFKNPVQSIGGWISGALTPLNDFVKNLVDTMQALLDKLPKMPKIDLPKVTVPKITLPKLTLPEFGKPNKPNTGTPDKPVSKPVQTQPVSKPLTTPAGTTVKPLATGAVDKPDIVASNKNNTYNVQINAGTNATPEDIATSVMAAISGKYSTYKQGAMA